MATPSEKPEFVLFFSKQCKFCRNFNQKLNEKEELVKKIRIVDIDIIENVPDEVQEVPCMYDGKRVYQGQAAFKWLEEKMSEYLSAANDGLQYSFLNGNTEPLFSNYSLLEQKNGSFGMDKACTEDPTRMATLPDNSNKNSSYEALLSSRSEQITPL